MCITTNTSQCRREDKQGQVSSDESRKTECGARSGAATANPQHHGVERRMGDAEARRREEQQARPPQPTSPVCGRGRAQRPGASSTGGTSLCLSRRHAQRACGPAQEKHTCETELTASTDDFPLTTSGETRMYHLQRRDPPEYVVHPPRECTVTGAAWEATLEGDSCEVRAVTNQTHNIPDLSRHARLMDTSHTAQAGEKYSRGSRAGTK
jgi:hypothetical protein